MIDDGDEKVPLWLAALVLLVCFAASLEPCDPDCRHRVEQHQ